MPVTYTSHNVTATASSTQFLNKNAQRRAFILNVDKDGANGIWLNFGADAAADTGMYLPAGGYLTLTEESAPQNTVNIIADGADVKVSILEGA